MMNTETQKKLKEKVHVLEKTLLAISSLNEICHENEKNGLPPLRLENLADLLDYLIEPAIYQVESLRMQIDELEAA